MSIRFTLPLVLLLVGAMAPVTGADTKQPEKETAKNARFEQFKQLAGDWVGKAQGREIHIQYKVTSGGSAVMETIFPGSEHEMVTLIHPDGDDLLLTHYCMLGNQPHMRASAQGEVNKVEFKFVRATNLKSEKSPHMHDATYTFVDRDTLKTAWTHYKDGKDAGQMAFELKRKK